jgi:exoribonuclease R
MRSLRDTTHALEAGLADIREEFAVPRTFAPEVLDAADAAARRVPSEHTDLTEWPFVTLDPSTSTDLDQAFTLTASGTAADADLVLHYAIADVAWFVIDGDLVDQEAWRRGTTLYLPDGKASLYPRVLAEGAASLLPDGPRPAVVFHVRIDSSGIATLDGAERALVRSRAKLGYESVNASDLPAVFGEFSRRVEAADIARGAGRVEPPEQLVERSVSGYRLSLRPRLPSEDQNASLSLAANLAVGAALFRAGTGLFRVMDEPDDRAVTRLHHAAAAFGLTWPPEQSLVDFVRTLDGNDPKQAAFMLAERRAGGGARYVTFSPGVIPWHAALAATYSHATAPLRRLADRYTVQAALAVANGNPVPDHVVAALPRLPDVMAKADAEANRVDRAVIDLAEAVMLQGSEGVTYRAIVIDDDDEAARVQLCDLAVVARVKIKGQVRPGDEVRVRLISADPAQRRVTFERVA